MKSDFVSITSEPIDSQQLLGKVGDESAGAIVLFVGTTRRWTEGRETAELEYECYETMALKKMNQLIEEANDRWDLVQVAMTHRIGTVPIGDASVAVAVSAPHRNNAFEAASWLIDTLKKMVPIWKQEIWADGSTEWIHPGIKLPQRNSLQSNE